MNRVVMVMMNIGHYHGLRQYLVLHDAMIFH